MSVMRILWDCYGLADIFVCLGKRERGTSIIRLHIYSCPLPLETPISSWVHDMSEGGKGGAWSALLLLDTQYIVIIIFVRTLHACSCSYINVAVLMLASWPPLPWNLNASKMPAIWYASAAQWHDCDVFPTAGGCLNLLSPGKMYIGMPFVKMTWKG